MTRSSIASATGLYRFLLHVRRAELRQQNAVCVSPARSACIHQRDTPTGRRPISGHPQTGPEP